MRLGLGVSMAGAGLAFAVGAASFHLVHELPPAHVSLIGLALAAVASWRWPRVSWLLPLAVGAGWAHLHLYLLLSSPFPDGLAREPLSVTGRVASIPEQTERGTRFLFAVQDAIHAGSPISLDGLVRLSCYRDCPGVRAGELWRFDVRLKPRHGYANPGGFDYERWLFERGILATGYLIGGSSVERLDAGPGRHWLTRTRQALGERLAGALPDSAQLGLIQGLVIGERSGIDRATWDVLTRTGTNHLVAISGLHIGLIAGAAFFLARWLWSRSAGAVALLAAPRAAALVSAFAALGYAGLAGFAVSTQRALIMLAVVLGAVYWGRTLRPYHGLSLAAAAVLLWDPVAVLSIGFWLSFGAVGLLLLSLGQRLPDRGLWARWGRAQWAVGLGLLPLLFLFFGRASMVAPLVNLLAVPLFSLVLLPLVLIGSLISLASGFDLPLVGAAMLLDWSMQGLAWVAAQPWAAIQIPARPLWIWIGSGLGVLLLLAPRGLPGRWLGLILILPLLVFEDDRPAEGEIWLTVLDVGQGLAVVFQTRTGVLAFDTGPGYASGFNTGAQVLAPFLMSRGVSRLDRLILSHADQDHAGGLTGLAERVPIDEVLSGEPGELSWPDARPCRAGEGWGWGGVSFRILHPEASSGRVGNNASCVLRVESGESSILVTGDVDERIERGLVARFGEGLEAEVLIAGHHGSASSSSTELLQAVAPSWVLFSSGYRNQYGFPRPEVVRRAADIGAEMRDTAISGALLMKLGPGGLIEGPVGWRDSARRLWTHRPEQEP